MVDGAGDDVWGAVGALPSLHATGSVRPAKSVSKIMTVLCFLLTMGEDTTVCENAPVYL